MTDIERTLDRINRAWEQFWDAERRASQDARKAWAEIEAATEEFAKVSKEYKA